jgi:hypothetical protein
MSEVLTEACRTVNWKSLYIFRKGIFSRRSLMGKVVIDLSDSQMIQGSPNWYQLEEAEEHSD